jgi:hypothetical protein
MSKTEEIPRIHGRTLDATITLWVPTLTKEKWVTLKDIHKVRVAECARKVVEAELDRLLLAVEEEILAEESKSKAG